VLAHAQIEIVDDADQIEDRVSIVGAGEVGLATKGRCEFQVISSELTGPPPDAVIVLRDSVVFLEVKTAGALRVNGRELGSAERMAVEHELIAYICAAMHRRLRVRTILFTTASLLSVAGAVIRMKPTQLETWSARAAVRGARRVSEHLARLRANGSIDENGKLLVPLPADMNPDSSTDV
jgi:hypothetical protein